MTTADPKIEFTPWVPWHDRRRLKMEGNDTWGGTYLFARFQQAPDVLGAPWPDFPQEIIYVGESKDLNRRPLSGHNRTGRYHKMFGDWEKDNLYVSVCRLYPKYTREPPAIRVFAVYLESRICWEYTKKYGVPPAMHFKEKEGAPKKKRASSATSAKSGRRKKKKT